MAQDIEYSSFEKVTRITEGSNEVQFTYGPEYARKIMRRYGNSILVLRKSMLGLAERENGNFLRVYRGEVPIRLPVHPVLGFGRCGNRLFGTRLFNKIRRVFGYIMSKSYFYSPSVSGVQHMAFNGYAQS
jgi:hypothetical protein